MFSLNVELIINQQCTIKDLTLTCSLKAADAQPLSVAQMK